jgi:ankyrin repeat protein
MDEKKFFQAVKNGDIDFVSLQIAETPGLVMAIDRDRSTALHWAAWKGHSEMIRLLVGAGADLEAHNENSHWGTTPLHAAAHGNRKDAAKTLIDLGANVDAVKLGGQGTPLQETEVHNATAVAKILREAGATR